MGGAPPKDVQCPTWLFNVEALDVVLQSPSQIAHLSGSGPHSMNLARAPLCTSQMSSDKSLTFLAFDPSLENKRVGPGYFYGACDSKTLQHII